MFSQEVAAFNLFIHYSKNMLKIYESKKKIFRLIEFNYR